VSAICAPPAELRGVDGYHWVQLPFVAVATPIAWMVNPDNLEREWRMPSSAAFVSGESKTAQTWRYLCPTLAPAEADALRAELQRCEDACFDVQRDNIALRARQAELLAAAWGVMNERAHADANAMNEALDGLRAAIAKATTP
jgi:hypothetical protein